MEPHAHHGKVAVVTGASRGIGLAVAMSLVNAGARVCLTARKEQSLRIAIERLGGAANAIGVAGGADDAEHQTKAIDVTMESFGRIDYLVNNAGINPHFGPLLGISEPAARKSIDVNCLAPLDWIRLVQTAWMKEHGGSIVNMSSIAGIRPATNIGFYGATKAMLGYMTQQLATELGPRTRVNAVAPGVVKTDFAAKLYEGREEEVAATYPLQRLGLPSDIADAVSFLLSDAASWMTGQVVVLDGGVTLRGTE